MIIRTTIATILCLSLLSMGILMAGELDGTVIDSATGDSLPGVHLSIDGTKVGTASQSDGHYKISNLAPGEYTVNIHLIGYKKSSRRINIGDTAATMMNVALEQMPWELDNVVVTATRSQHLLKDVPVTTELITREDMASTGALTVDQALESHIGVTVDDDLSGKGVSLRGVDPSRVLILIDGRRVIGRVRGSIDLGQISLSDVDRIEIVKGSGSTLYGSDAIGGVINIITKKPSGNNSLQSSMEYGSFRTFDPEFQWESRYQKFGASVSGKYEKTDGFDLDKSTPHTNGLEAVKRYNLGTKLDYDLSQSFQNELSLGYMHERKQWVESEYFEPLQKTFAYDDYEWNNRYDVGTSHKYVANPKTEFELSTHGSWYTHDWSKYTSTGSRDDSSVTKDYILEASLQGNHSILANALITTGADISGAGLESSQIQGDQRKVTFGDMFMQLEWSPWKTLTFLPGVREEYHQTYGLNFTPSFNLRWSPSERFALRGTVGRGYRAPSVKELYFIFDHSAAGYVVNGGGNDLNPEKSNNYSLTAELNYGRRGLHRLTFFRNDLNNLIDFSLVEFTPTYWRGVYKYQNIVKARTSGLEWESKVKVCTGWDLSFSYTYLNARNLTENIDLINRPKNTAKFTSTFYVPQWNAGLTFWGSYQDHKLWASEGDTPDRISNIYAPKRFTFNFNLYKRFLRYFEGYFRMENIANETNVTYGYWPPRSYTVGLRLNLANHGESHKEQF